MNNKEALIKVGNMHSELIQDLKNIVNKYTHNDFKTAVAIVSMELRRSEPQNSNDPSNGDRLYAYRQTSQRFETNCAQFNAYLNMLAAFRDPIAFNNDQMLICNIADYMMKNDSLSQAEAIEVAKGLK